jgi:hypothetical protein
VKDGAMRCMAARDAGFNDIGSRIRKRGWPVHRGAII